MATQNVFDASMFRASDFGSQLQNREIAAKERRDGKEMGWFESFCDLCVLVRLIL